LLGIFGLTALKLTGHAYIVLSVMGSLTDETDFDLEDFSATSSLNSSNKEHKSNFSSVYSTGHGHSVVNALRLAWITERGAPEILFFEEEMVQTVKSLIEEQQAIIDEGRAEHKSDFLANIQQMEVDRLTYILNSYVRTRLKKIEKYALYILRNAGILERLSEFEKKFAEGYVDLFEAHMMSSFLEHLPPNVRSIEQQTADTNMIDEPDLNQIVFARFKQDVGQVQITELDEFVIKAGDLLALPYSTVKDFLLDGQAELV